MQSDTVPEASDNPAAGPTLIRGLSVWDTALLTVGSVIGTGIFITTGDIARVLPSEWWILGVWLLGGLFTLCGALSYAELGAMYPRSGGQYEYLKEAYGPLWGFLFGWVAFWVMMSGGIAALAVGFGEYLGAFVPTLGTGNVLFEVSLGGVVWSVNGGQMSGAVAIAVLSGINYVGLRAGARTQNFLTILKIGAILGIGGFGLLVPMTGTPAISGQLPATGLLGALGVALVAVLWTFDGWYGATAVAGEVRDPGRDLPLGIMLGTVGITSVYMLINFAYVRALSPEEMAATGRIAETSAQVLFGPWGAQLVSAAVLVSTFGCISATILYAARFYLPMAEDGLFFPSLARIHPVHRVPSNAILAQGVWAILLTFSGTYDQLYTYVVFALVMFHTLTGVGVFVLRRKAPDVDRPYRAWGYPWVPLVFILSSAFLVVNTLMERPVESLVGLGFLAAGLPAYAWWRRHAPRDQK